MEPSTEIHYQAQLAAHAGVLPFLSPYLSLSENGSNNTHNNRNTESNPTMSLDYLYDGNDYRVPHELHYQRGMGPLHTSGTASGPTSPPLTTPGTASPASNHSPPTDEDVHLVNALLHEEFKNDKRRMQNRAAQRRFRERKEQREKSLQQMSDELQAKYQALLEEHRNATSEVARLVQENKLLQSEAKSLRQQWQVMLALLQRPTPPGASPRSLGGSELEDLANNRSNSLQRCLEEFAGEEPHKSKSG